MYVYMYVCKQFNKMIETSNLESINVQLISCLFVLSFPSMVATVGACSWKACVALRVVR